MKSRLEQDGKLIFLPELKVEHPDLNCCMKRTLEALQDEHKWGDDVQRLVEDSLKQHADLGPEALTHGVAVVHQQLNIEMPDAQLLLRLPPGLELRDQEGNITLFLWVLISNQQTHPWMDKAAEFANLMEDNAFREEALAAKDLDSIDLAYHNALDRETHFQAHIPPELKPTKIPFAGLKADIARRLPHYISDFKDGFTPKTIASVVFLFFACFAPAVAFGGLLSQLTHGELGAIEMIVATTLCGVVYALFSGQPLTILGSTGPIIIFMGILYELCQRLQIPYLATLAWVGLWTSFFLIILAITNASTLIRYFTRFTDDTFAALISMIFIFEALRDVVNVFTGHQVQYATALLSLVLALGTYTIAMNLSRFRKSPYLRHKVREFLADFGPSIAIIIMSVIAYLLHEVDLKTLAVPAKFSTTSGRPWLVDIFTAPKWVWFAAAGPALLVSILVYLDQNITVRLVNSPQNKLTKGAGYHLDLGIVAILIGVSSLFGLPWMVAATVRSLNHVRSLAKIETIQTRDGVKERILGAVENRLSGLLVHILVGLSLLFLPLVAKVPMAVLFGLFLYMGVASMNGNQLFERLRLWVMDPLHYPPTHCLRAVPLSRVHVFTAIQMLALIVLWVVKTSALGILFPLFIGLLVPVRMVMARFFKQEHLALLDAEETPEEEELRETAL